MPAPSSMVLSRVCHLATGPSVPERVGWSDEDTFFGVAERIDEQNVDNVLRARQVVTCELRTLACTPVSPVIPAQDDGQSPAFLVEGGVGQL